jgi:hypothetical protein
MTRLNAMRALLALPEKDGYQRQRGLKTPLPADHKAHDDPDYSFFIVNADRPQGAYLIVDDECWDEADAFARAILDGISARRARKAQAEASPEHVIAESVL